MGNSSEGRRGRGRGHSLLLATCCKKKGGGKAAEGRRRRRRAKQQQPPRRRRRRPPSSPRLASCGINNEKRLRGGTDVFGPPIPPGHMASAASGLGLGLGGTVVPPLLATLLLLLARH